ncbi:MAG: [FeFe] hydrogenase H-cluster maturation GTPase HydF [Acholeplasmataceae bacterium]|nr:[FeFe] hydrogenase H-cluster maturation GTPase HydF [Acidaminococcaceae bacterium]NLY83316.1 [FeFe] hydrogenase H-cluster maturation GTPase HydF [Acholeplasmataceae bacterium]
MSLNETPSSHRVHIGFFGKRNAGKSSVVNAVTGQKLSVVSPVKGTTTDPVYKAMELLPLGPVMIIDTPGYDDEGELGTLRVEKARQVLNKTDVAILVIDAAVGKTSQDEEILGLFAEKGLNYVVVYNKADLLAEKQPDSDREIYVSAETRFNIEKLKEKIGTLAATEEPRLQIVGDLLAPGDFAVLVIPIDKAAPKGRLILPQQQTIRDILEADATAIVVKEDALAATLAALGQKPKIVITDSQVFARVAAVTPDDVFLTSFSILFARFKGNLAAAVEGARALDELSDGDAILIAEGCTHHRQCDDIGTVKLPRWIREYTKKDFNFVFTSGTEFPPDLSRFKLIIHCGACMLNEREMRHRQKVAGLQAVPMTNYGVIISHMQGILSRSIRVFPSLEPADRQC